MVFDAHIHNTNHESGGFLIGLEGEPRFNQTLTNKEVIKLHNPQKMYYAFYYVTKDEIHQRLDHPFLKYHPRRERYGVKDVMDSIRLNSPKIIIIDTLNEPYWVPYDYWRIALEFPDIPMVFAHSGGYLINEFIKICHFQPNVWIDFALTHTTLGKFGDKSQGLPYINDAIHYALNGPFKDRVLLSSDYPFFNQDAVFEYYVKYQELLNNNFLMLIKENIYDTTD